MLYDQYTLSSNKHDSTNPASDSPAPPFVACLCLPFNHIQAVFHLVLLLYGRVVAPQVFFIYIYLLQPFFLSGLFLFPLSTASLMKTFSCSGRNSSFIGKGSADGLRADLQRCGFHSFISPSFHVSISSCVGLNSGILKISFCFQRSHTVFLQL